jgi:tRNA U38,U39,U40 pseudouridine synthase TruA
MAIPAVFCSGGGRVADPTTLSSEGRWHYVREAERAHEPQRACDSRRYSVILSQQAVDKRQPQGANTISTHMSSRFMSIMSTDLTHPITHSSLQTH